ncbi:MAG: sulfurtransferase [Lutibacter sp.]|nr:MAG: sulfurtransferase [Lutibacter sp.]
MASPLVTVDWLNQNLNNPNLVIIDATMRKITWEKNEFKNSNLQIIGTRFFDIKNTFSDTSSPFPNMMLSPDKFQEQAQKIGINKESKIVVYDTIGIYTSPRVWWMFKSMGHHNIAVLDGGFPEWNKRNFPKENTSKYKGDLGNFIADFNQNYFCDYKAVLNSISDKKKTIIDARSEDRFDGVKEEPRKGLRSGHIPNSRNLHYNDLLVEGNMKSKEELIEIFNPIIAGGSSATFSCGSGITACILALGAEITGRKNNTVYDGSWTEWGSLHELPIEN